MGIKVLIRCNNCKYEIIVENNDINYVINKLLKDGWSFVMKRIKIRDDIQIKDDIKYYFFCPKCRKYILNYCI